MPGPVLAKFARRRKPDWKAYYISRVFGLSGLYYSPNRAKPGLLTANTKNRILERTDIGNLRTDIMDSKKEVTGLNEGVARCMVGVKYLHRSSYTIQNGN